MSRIFAYLGNDSARVGCALHGARELWRAEADDTLALRAAGAPSEIDGWGIGYYQSHEILLQRRPAAPPHPIDFYEAARALRSDAIIGHVRAGTIGDARSENTHPFRFRSWLFAHHGTVPRFAEVGAQLRQEVPEFLARSIRGETDSEVLFHRILAALHEAGRLDDPNVSTAHVRAAITVSMARLRDLAGADAMTTAELALVMTNGRLLVALRHGDPLHVYQVNGIVDCPLCRENQPARGRAPRPVNHDQLRAVALVGGGVVAPEGATRTLANRTFLSVSESISVEEAPLQL